MIYYIYIHIYILARNAQEPWFSRFRLQVIHGLRNLPRAQTAFADKVLESVGQWSNHDQSEKIPP